MKSIPSVIGLNPHLPVSESLEKRQESCYWSFPKEILQSGSRRDELRTVRERGIQ